MAIISAVYYPHNPSQFSSTYSEQSEDNYRALLAYTFDMTDGANAAGLSYLRVPIGASNSSSQGYSSDDTSGDTSFSSFNIDAAPSYLFSVINVIRSIKSDLEVHIVPWSPPAWMKDSGIMNGGSLKSNLISASVEGQIGAGLRTLRNNNGLSSAKVVGYEVDAATYPIQDAGNSFASVAFHCYKGSVANQDSFHSAFSSKDRILEQHKAMPDQCKDSRRGIVNVSSDGSYRWNQPVNGSAYLSKDHLAERLESMHLRLDVYHPVTGSGTQSWFSIGTIAHWIRSPWKLRLNSEACRLNSLQAMYTFPVGVTTLWWFAPVNVNVVRANGTRVWGLKNSGHKILLRVAWNI
ncbi:glycoside hydrolase [Mycena floridula]|nr:glycoside hydrolase [Mycena floridula]